MRCPICGRPDTDAELLPREIKCDGCIEDMRALIAEGKLSNEQIKAEAVRRRMDRGMALWAARTGNIIIDQTQKAKDDADDAVEAVKP